jgi:hypothetical protein
MPAATTPNTGPKMITQATKALQTAATALLRETAVGGEFCNLQDFKM